VGHLVPRERLELGGDRHVLLELGDVVDSHDHRAHGLRQRVAHRVAHGGDPSLAEDAAAGGDLHADHAHLLLIGERQQLVHERQVVRVGRVERHQDRVEVEATDPVGQHGRVGVTRDPEEADRPLLPGLEHRLDGAVLAEDRVQLVGSPDIVELPQVEVVGLERLQALLQQAQ
jgi:hypothetical protein